MSKHSCIPKISGVFVGQMKDMLNLYTGPLNSEKPVVRFDETSSQMLAGAQSSFPVESRKVRRKGYEFRRKGTHTLLLAREPLAGWRYVALTMRRTTEDISHETRWLVDEAYSGFALVYLFLDNLNTDDEASIYQPLTAGEQ